MRELLIRFLYWLLARLMDDERVIRHASNAILPNLGEVELEMLIRRVEEKR